MITLFHGSNVAVEKPLAGIGRRNLDFGVGFYVTSIEEQATIWALNKARYYNQQEGFISRYDFDLEAATDTFRFRCFENYDREWLHFIVNNRSGGQEWKQWDIIEGGVANDRVIDTVESYMAGLTSEETALGLLAQHRPNHQICIVNQSVIDKYLHFVESVPVKVYAE